MGDGFGLHLQGFYWGSIEGFGRGWSVRELWRAFRVQGSGVGSGFRVFSTQGL